MSSPDPPVHGTQRGAAGEAPAVVDVDQLFDADGLYRLRATLAAHASRLGLTDRQVDSLLIVASELATNAIRHGGGSGRLRLWRQDDSCYCQVSDQGPGFADVTVGTTPPDPTSPDGGRGIWICRNLASQLVIESRPDGRGAIVTAVLADC